ncbi:PIN domain-containing protein [Alteromonas macleodii]|uniref:PIN domain-containing protein n=1 Tax=Alteromonas macleodii TaxID=28108 RepID=UPI000C77142B|nr:PIN domain-containing protein [Alteromonas macleodii]AUI81051.1 hypothetical protein TE101_01500 [Alteromonas macleodii]
MLSPPAIALDTKKECRIGDRNNELWNNTRSTRMRNIVLDTNILHQEGLSSRNMLLLKRLIKAEAVHLHIPEIVKREFISRKIYEAKESLKKSSDSLAILLKKSFYDNNFKDSIVNAQTILNTAEMAIENQILEQFNRWVDDLAVNVIDFKPEDINQVLDDYFSGNGVYRKAKSREDIPDAMICSIITNLLRTEEKLSIVIKDGTFKAHLETLAGITIYDSLADVLEERSLKTEIEQLDNLSEKAETIKGYLSSPQFLEKLYSFLQDTKSEVGELYLEEQDVILNDQFGIQSFGERVDYVDPSTLKELKIDDVAWLENESYSLKISFIAKGTVLYCATYGEYLILEKNLERDVSYDSMNGDGICDLSEVMDLLFEGLITVDIEKELDVEAVKAHCEYLDSPSNPIRISLDIDTVEVLMQEGSAQ